MNTQYTAGQKVYTSHGQEGEFVAIVEGKFAVRPIELWGDEEHAGEIVLWDHVCDVPPTEKLHAEISALEEKSQKLREEISEIQKERRQEEDAIKARKEALKRHKSLEILEGFLNGEVTHFVIFSEYQAPKIVDVKDTTSEYSDKDTLRLVSLSGKIKGWKEKTIQYDIHTYSDGSGCGKERISPCFSYEEALSVVINFLENKWEEFRNAAPHSQTGRKVCSFLDRYSACANTYSIPVPQDVQDAVHQDAIYNAEDAVNSRQKELDAAKAKLKAVKEAA